MLRFGREPIVRNVGDGVDDDVEVNETVLTLLSDGKTLLVSSDVKRTSFLSTS